MGNQNGAVFVTVALAIPLIVALILYVTQMYRVFEERARMQELADAAAVSAASMQARSLNAIALLNDALLGIEGLAAGVFIAGNSAALVLDALIITAPEGVTIHQEDFEVTRQLGELSRQVAGLQDVLVPIFEFPPLFAAQLPLLLEDLDPAPILLPYPLPGMRGQTLSLAMPTEKRGFGFENLMAQANEFAVSGAKEALRSASETFPVEKGLKRARDGCRIKVFLKKSMEDGCKKLLSFTDGDFVNGVGKELTKLLQGPRKPLISGGDLLGKQSEFPPPLILETGYADNYQIAVLAVRCRPWVDCDRDALQFSDFNFAIAQARAHSNSQRQGGDLLIPDFSARLVPVSVLDVSEELTAFMEQTPWSFKH